MRRCLRWAFCLSLLTTVTGSSLAQEGVKSGPQAGEVLPGPFHPFNATGDFKDRPHCLVCEFGLLPTVAVFTREFPAPDRPVTKLLQALDAAVEKYRPRGLRAFAVVLTDESQDVDARRAAAQRLKDLADAAKLKHVVLSLDAAAGPKEYKLSPEAGLTVLVYVKQKVEANFAFPKDAFADDNVKAILAAVEKLFPTAK
jgi:hypothetical protein